jgi:hypothetical protein
VTLHRPTGSRRVTGARRRAPRGLRGARHACGTATSASRLDSTSFSFFTLPGHFRGPGRTIRFTILVRAGRLMLRQVGATSLGIFDMAYDGGAPWLSWRIQAATLRAALASQVGDHR